MMQNFRRISGLTLGSHPLLVPLGAFLLYLLLLLTLGALLVKLISVLSGFDLLTASEALRQGSGPASAAAWAFRGIQAVNQLPGYGLAALIMAWLLGRPQHELSLSPAPPPFFLLVGMLTIISSLPLVQLLMIRPEYLEALGWNGSFFQTMMAQEDNAQVLLEAIFVGAENQSLLGNLLIFAVLPAFCEEAFFRGLIQRQLSRHLSPHVAIWLAAAIFSFIHFQFLGFFSRWLLGAMLGYFLYYSGSLWPAIFAHFCFNAVSVVGASIYPELAEPDYQFSWGPVGLSVLLAGGLMGAYVHQGRARILNESIHE